MKTCGFQFKQDGGGKHLKADLYNQVGMDALLLTGCCTWTNQRRGLSCSMRGRFQTPSLQISPTIQPMICMVRNFNGEMETDIANQLKE
jgi:hypothetical protein